MALADTFKALSDAQRRQILTMLRGGRRNAGEIADGLQISPAALSYHLKLLKKADLVLEYREKNFMYYELNTGIFDEIILWMRQFGGDGYEAVDPVDTGLPATGDRAVGVQGAAGQDPGTL